MDKNFNFFRMAILNCKWKNNNKSETPQFNSNSVCSHSTVLNCDFVMKKVSTHLTAVGYSNLWDLYNGCCCLFVSICGGRTGIKQVIVPESWLSVVLSGIVAQNTTLININ